MGAVNYGTSDYINIGLNVGADLDELEVEQIRDEVQGILDKYGFYYFYVDIKPGYYEGFYIDIENNFPVAFDWYEEKQDAQKELTQLKKCLLECVGAGLVQYSPGWCTGYYTPAETVEHIKTAIKSARDEVKHTPTWAQYNAV